MADHAASVGHVDGDNVLSTLELSDGEAAVGDVNNRDLAPLDAKTKATLSVAGVIDSANVKSTDGQVSPDLPVGDAHEVAADLCRLVGELVEGNVLLGTLVGVHERLLGNRLHDPLGALEEVLEAIENQRGVGVVEARELALERFVDLLLEV